MWTEQVKNHSSHSSLLSLSHLPCPFFRSSKSEREREKKRRLSIAVELGSSISSILRFTSMTSAGEMFSSMAFLPHRRWREGEDQWRNIFWEEREREKFPLKEKVREISSQREGEWESERRFGTAWRQLTKKVTIDSSLQLECWIQLKIHFNSTVNLCWSSHQFFPCFLSTILRFFLFSAILRFLSLSHSFFLWFKRMSVRSAESEHQRVVEESNMIRETKTGYHCMHSSSCIYDLFTNQRNFFPFFSHAVYFFVRVR